VATQQRHTVMVVGTLVMCSAYDKIAAPRTVVFFKDANIKA